MSGEPIRSPHKFVDEFPFAFSRHLLPKIHLETVIWFFRLEVPFLQSHYSCFFGNLYFHSNLKHLFLQIVPKCIFKLRKLRLPENLVLERYPSLRCTLVSYASGRLAPFIGEM